MCLQRYTLKNFPEGRSEICCKPPEGRDTGGTTDKMRLPRMDLRKLGNGCSMYIMFFSPPPLWWFIFSKKEDEQNQRDLKDNNKLLPKCDECLKFFFLSQPHHVPYGFSSHQGTETWLLGSESTWVPTTGPIRNSKAVKFPTFRNSYKLIFLNTNPLRDMKSKDKRTYTIKCETGSNFWILTVNNKCFQ